MVSSASALTSARCAGRRVLVIQDTTVTRSQGGGGSYLHAAIALDADDDTLLGLVHAEHLVRGSGKKATRRQRAVRDKESGRWLRGADAAATVCSEARQITVIADRESDIFAAFAECPGDVELLVRAAQNRCLEDGGRLFGSLDGLPEAGRVRLDLPAKPGRAARQALLAVRFAPVELARPRSSATGSGRNPGLPDSLRVTALDVREVGSSATPVHWRLLISRPVDDLAEALAVVDLYRRRWAIEQLFRTMKTKGFDIEGVLIAEEAPRQKLLTATLIAAITVQQLVHARDGIQGPGPLRPATDAFTPDDRVLLEAFCRRLEGRTARQKNPHPKGSLAYAAWVCARLGGWTGYYGKPGPIVLLNGWLQFQAAKAGANLFRQKHNV